MCFLQLGVVGLMEPEAPCATFESFELQANTRTDPVDALESTP